MALNRLTKRDRFGNAHYPPCFEEPCRGEGCTNQMCPTMTEACELLAQYEETGYNPGEIQALIAYEELEEDKRQLLFQIGTITSLDHMAYLVKKEARGQLADLPGKPGCPLWMLQVSRTSGRRGATARVAQTTLNERNLWRILVEKELGHTLFRTVEEAMEAKEAWDREHKEVFDGKDC